MHPNVENKIVMPITKAMEIIISIQVCLLSQMNLDFKDNGGKKAFPANPKRQYRVSYYGERDCNASNKKNGDCYGYPCLSHFMDEL